MNAQIYLEEFAEPPGYLDFARVGPLSRAVASRLASVAAMRVDGMPLDRLAGYADAARDSAALLLGAAAHEVSFVSSTSHGLFAAAAAVRGDGVVLVPRGEFPANVYPWLRFQGRGGPRVRFVDAPRLTPEVLAVHLDPSVRALTVSAVDALTGYRAPLGALKEVLGPGRVLVVDAIQGLGAVPLEVEAADVLACGGQKWLRAGWGTALLLIRDRVAHLLEPGLGGWSGIKDPDLGGWSGVQGPAEPTTEPLPGAVAHTVTNPDYAAVAALGTALDLVRGVGVAEIGRRVTATLAELLDAARGAGARVLLDGLAPEERGGIAAFTLPGRNPAAVHAALTAAGLTTTLRGEWIRLSPHATTPRQAVQRLATTLKESA